MVCDELKLAGTCDRIVTHQTNYIYDLKTGESIELAALGYAVQLANDSTYGLAGTVWSADLQRATDVARRLDTGVVGINSWDLDIGAPFGGRRHSGLGSELGPEGIDEYLRYKTMFIGRPA